MKKLFRSIENSFIPSMCSKYFKYVLIFILYIYITFQLGQVNSEVLHIQDHEVNNENPLKEINATYFVINVSLCSSEPIHSFDTRLITRLDLLFDTSSSESVLCLFKLYVPPKFHFGYNDWWKRHANLLIHKPEPSYEHQVKSNNTETNDKQDHDLGNFTIHFRENNTLYEHIYDSDFLVDNNGASFKADQTLNVTFTSQGIPLTERLVMTFSFANGSIWKTLPHVKISETVGKEKLHFNCCNDTV